MTYHGPKILGISGLNLLNNTSVVFFQDTISPEYEWDLLSLMYQVSALTGGGVEVTLADDYQTLIYRPMPGNMMLQQLIDENGDVRSVHRMKGRLVATLNNKSGGAIASYGISILIRQIPANVYEV